MWFAVDGNFVADLTACSVNNFNFNFNCKSAVCGAGAMTSDWGSQDCC